MTFYNAIGEESKFRIQEKIKRRLEFNNFEIFLSVVVTNDCNVKVSFAWSFNTALA